MNNLKKIILVLLCIICSTKLFAYSFSVITYGDTIYYDVTSSSSPYTVAVTFSSAYTNSYTGAISIPSSVTYNSINYSVTSIGEYAFHDCSGLTSVSVPNTILLIGQNAFYYCTGLTYISIPAAVTSIGQNAFVNCINLTTIIIPNTMTVIKAGTFLKCSKLSSISIPNSIIKIEDYAFEACKNLTSLTIPNSVTTIGIGAFDSCISLTNIVLGNSIDTIKDYAFQSCVGLTKILLKKTIPPKIFTNTFNYVNRTIPVYVPCGSSSLYSTTSLWNTFTNCKDSLMFTVSVQANKSAWGTVTKTNTLSCTNDTCVITATPKNSYNHFLYWNDGDTTSSRIIKVFKDTIFTAIFAIDSHSVFLYIDTTMGSVSGNRNYAYGTNAYIMAIPKAHYHFIKWNDNNKFNPRMFTVINDTSFTAIMGLDTHSVTILCNDTNMGIVSSNGKYPYNSTINISATANSQYHFVKWNDENIDNPRTITVIKDTVFTAIFAIDSNIVITNSDTNMGTVLGAGIHARGSFVILTAISKPHYHFMYWNDGDTNNPRTIAIFQDTVLTAIFAIDTHQINVLSSNDSWGTVTGSGFFPYGSIDTLTATRNLNDNYFFHNWNDGNLDSVRIITVTQDSVFTAIFMGMPHVEETDVNNTIKLYPNPASDKLIIDFNEGIITEVKLFDVIGREVKSMLIDNSRAILTISDIHAGIYFVKIISEKEILFRKFEKK